MEIERYYYYNSGGRYETHGIYFLVRLTHAYDKHARAYT